MCKVFSISNHTPIQLISWLNGEFSVRPSSISILPIGKNLNDDYLYKRVNKHVIIQRYADLDNNIKILLSKPFRTKIIYVFASPIKLHKYTNLVKSLDCLIMESTALFCHELKSKLDASMYTEAMVSRSLEIDADILVPPTYDYVTTIIESTKGFNSILNSLMSLIYLLPSSTHQKPVKNVVCFWIYRHASESKLLDILDRLAVYAPMSESVRSRFIKVLFSDTSKLYIQAFKDYSKCDQNDEYAIDRISSKYSISAYDMRYIRAIALTYDKYSSEVKHSLTPIYKGK